MAFPVSPTNGQIYKNYRFNSNRWSDIAIIPRGFNSTYPAISSKNMNLDISQFYAVPNGSYWIKGARDSSPVKVYCENSINGGGWMSFASVNKNTWFSGNSGSQVSWSGLSYSYGSYSSDGAIGDYWRNYSNQDVTEIMFMTGNKNYWVSFPLSYIVAATEVKTYTTGITTSNNFPVDSYQYNSTLSIYHRAVSEDPWINVGNAHAAGQPAGDYMFWGENNSNMTTHSAWQVSQGGIIVFVR